MPGSSSVAVGQRLAGRAIDRLFHQLMRGLKAFADLMRTTSLACVHEKMGRIFRPRLQLSLTKFMFARMEHLPSAIYDMKWCSAITATALNSVRPVLNSSSTTLACCVLFSCCRSNEVLGGYMAKIIEIYIPQSFRRVSKWFPPAERGKVLAFPLAVRKSA
jgi:hypothetical protein